MSFAKLPLAQPPWKTCGKKLESLTRKALYQFRMLDKVDNIALALSGGKDSLSLLFMLHAISGKGFPHFKIHAINISGKFSCGAQINNSYLSAICSSLNISYNSIPSPYDSNNPECYSCSRVRRRLLFQTAKNLNCNTIAFGHHKDDLAQTTLMNLLHKGEFAGMLPNIHMIRFNINTIRPLIFVPEDLILTFAKEYNFARIACRCPVVSLRKKTKETLNQLSHIFPNATNNLAHAALLYGSKKAEKIV